MGVYVLLHNFCELKRPVLEEVMFKVCGSFGSNAQGVWDNFSATCSKMETKMS